MTEATTEKPTILVADDSRLMRVAARKILKNEFEVIDAEDGEIAWDILQDNSRIALVMSDLSMPNLDGLGLLNKIRKSDQHHISDLPVIIVTGAEDDDGSKNAALSAGASDFITKPFESVQLLARTKAQAKQQRTQRALQDSESSKRQLAEQNKLDLLTGLANKDSFLRSIEEHLSYAIRHRTELSVLLVRLEKYKILFLRRGKKDAETIVRRIASLLKGNRRREDSVARIGLDTLAILMPSANHIGAGKVGEQLEDAVTREDFGGDKQSPSVSISIGVSSLAIRRDLTATELLEDAIKALNRGNDQDSAPCDKPMQTNTPPAEARLQPVIASPGEVHQALQAILNSSRPAQPADQLVRAILPLLDLWNLSANNRYCTLVEALKSALADTNTDKKKQQPATRPSAHLF